jgi:uncharacterized protein (TIGR03435 family)
MLVPTALTILYLTATHAYGQSSTEPLRFEVASVKPSPPMDTGNFFSRSGPNANRYSATNATLRTMLLFAYQLKDYQLQCPGWMETERYDVNAKAPEGTAPPQIREMLQNLLLERFKMTVHREQRDATVYFLTVGKNGHKMKESAPDPNPPPPAENAGAPPMIPQRPTGPPPTDKDGYPILSRTGWVSTSSPDGLMKVTASRQAMSDLIRMLGFQLGRDIVDQTGLTGRYDYRLAYGGSGPRLPGMPSFPRSGPAAQPGEASDPAGSSGGPTIFGALQDQLGLKLDAGKAPRDMLVVDKAEKMPIEN